MPELEDDLVELDVARDPTKGQPLLPAFEALIARCESAGLKVAHGGPRPVISFPRGGRGQQRIPVSMEDVAVLLAHPFETFRFVGRYDAVVSYEHDEIEAMVRLGRPMLAPEYLKRMLPTDVDEHGEIFIALIDEDLAPGVHVELSRMSDPLNALLRRWQRMPPPRRSRTLSLKIRGLGLTRHSATLAALETIADAFFFDLERTRQLQFELALTRDFRPGLVHRAVADRTVPLKLPRNRYDPEPAALYRYARSAAGMPLLRFLAYYQAIEFYMPRYAQGEARSQLENVVKDPAFNAHDSRQIGRLLEVARQHASSSGARDERSQLRLTLPACVDAAELAAYFDDDADTQTFFASKKSTLTTQAVSTKAAGDVRDQVADRVYDLRCKIVHTKDVQGSGQVELLLPNSAEADMLDNDIELLRFLASKVLVAASKPLTYHFS